MTDPLIAGIAGCVVGLFVGGVLMAILCDRTNKSDNARLQREMHDNSVMYLTAVQTMEDQISEKDRQLELKQRVMDSLNEEVARLRRMNAKLKRKEVDCDAE